MILMKIPQELDECLYFCADIDRGNHIKLYFKHLDDFIVKFFAIPFTSSITFCYLTGSHLIYIIYKT